MMLPPSNGSSNHHRSWRGFVWVVLSFLGFLDAAYLTIHHYRGTDLVCGVGDCEKVLTSTYATLGPVPIALIGGLHYLFLFLLAVGYLDTGRPLLARLVRVLIQIGFLISLLLAMLQIFIVHSFCVYFLLSVLLSILLFLTLLL